MKTFSKFEIIGHVGKHGVQEVGPTLRVSIAAEYGRKDDDGRFVSNPFWNEVTIFNSARFDWIKANIDSGDLVRTAGTLRQTKFERNGETVYTYTLAADEFDLLAKKSPPAT